MDYALSGEGDGLVLDIMMPGLDGIEVLKRLRKGKGDNTCFVLTARTEVSQRVEGLDAGADDYLPKAFFYIGTACPCPRYAAPKR